MGVTKGRLREYRVEQSSHRTQHVVRHPEFCIYNKEQIDWVQETGIDDDLLFINAHAST